MSWKSEEKEKSSPVVVAVGISFLHSAMLVMLKAGSDGESKKESLNEGVSTKTQEREPQKVTYIDKRERHVSIHESCHPFGSVKYVEAGEK